MLCHSPSLRGKKLSADQTGWAPTRRQQAIMYFGKVSMLYDDEGCVVSRRHPKLRPARQRGPAGRVRRTRQPRRRLTAAACMSATLTTSALPRNSSCTSRCRLPHPFLPANLFVGRLQGGTSYRHYPPAIEWKLKRGRKGTTINTPAPNLSSGFPLMLCLGAGASQYHFEGCMRETISEEEQDIPPYLSRRMLPLLRHKHGQAC